MDLTQIIEQLESCKFECEAGSLENNVAFIELKQLAENEAAVETATPLTPTDDKYDQNLT